MQLPSETVAVVGNIDPDAYAASTVTTGWVDASKFHMFMAVIQAGDLGISATLDAKLQQASDASGTGAKDVTSAAITQLTVANKQAIIDLDPSKLDTNNGFNHIRLSMTIGVAASDAGGVLLGLLPRFGPANANDASTVDEIVSVV